MSRNYVCGIIRDPLKRFLVIQYPLAEGRFISSVSAESWIGKYENPITALISELKLCLGISTLDIFDVKATRVLTTFSNLDTKVINAILIDIRETTPFILGDDVSNTFFMQWDHLLNAVNSHQIVPTTYSKCIVDRLYAWKDIA